MSDVIAALHAVESEVRRLRGERNDLQAQVDRLVLERDAFCEMRKNNIADCNTAHREIDTVAAFLGAAARGEEQGFESETRLQTAALELARRLRNAEDASGRLAAILDAALADVALPHITQEAGELERKAHALAKRKEYWRWVGGSNRERFKLDEVIGERNTAHTECDEAVARIRQMEKDVAEQLDSLNKLHDALITRTEERDAARRSADDFRRQCEIKGRRIGELQRDLEQATTRGDELEAQLKPLQAAAHDLAHTFRQCCGASIYPPIGDLAGMLAAAGSIFTLVHEHRERLVKEQQSPHRPDGPRARAAELAAKADALTAAREDLCKQLDEVIEERDRIREHAFYKCDRCGALRPWNDGAGDDMPNTCTACWNRAHRAECDKERVELEAEQSALKARVEAAERKDASQGREKQLRCALFLRCLQLPGVTSPEYAWTVASDAFTSLDRRDLTETMGDVLLGKAGR